MPFIQSIENARAERIGIAGAPSAEFDDALGRTGAALDWLRARHADGGLPLLRLPAKRDDLAGIGDAARRLCAGASDIVMLGTGGSSLGGQTLAQLAGYAVPGVGALRGPPRLHFMDNLDPDTYGALLAMLPLATTRFVAISKSGGTGETLMQTAAALAAVKDAGLSSRIPDLFLGLTEPATGGKRNGMRELFDAHKVAMLDHDPGVGGRYSVLTNVGLLPAAMLGLDIGAIRAGAAAALAPVLERRAPADVPAAVGAALSVAAGKPIAVMMAYADRLERFTRWYVQLWAESLGKNGKGTTPVAALGPVDQHSQLQLFIAGPRDKLFTIVTVRAAGRGPRITAELARLAGEPDFAGKTMGDLVAAQGRATAKTLAKNGCPVRTIHVDALDEASLGELLMHFMLETIIAAHLLGVDPFDQPAVEEGKVLAKSYLASS
ncbi:MAG: glucose-6-phosphate isomerase [Alphaproteobacteria bacterium]|jgi:glucose-6-phosphate isomerase|nr:glucose-6-phosphate isomerase [Alphaproteobacteria bacterium]